MIALIFFCLGGLFGCSMYYAIDLARRMTPPPDQDFSADLHEAVLRAGRNHNKS
jgi:hypothetical protein